MQYNGDMYGIKFQSPRGNAKPLALNVRIPSLWHLTLAYSIRKATYRRAEINRLCSIYL